MPGTGACAVGDAIALTRHAGEIGAAAVLLLPPFYYKKVSDDGLFAFVAKLIEGCGANAPRIMLYHIPPMAMVGWSAELIARLRDAFPDIIAGMKDSSGDAENTLAMIKAFPEGFAVFPGAEVYLLRALRAGAAGCISASANINAAGIRRLYDRWQEPDAEALQAELNAVRKAAEVRGMIPSLKAVLADALSRPGLAPGPSAAPSDIGGGAGRTPRRAGDRAAARGGAGLDAADGSSAIVLAKTLATTIAAADQRRRRRLSRRGRSTPRRARGSARACRGAPTAPPGSGARR